jgi:glutamate/tyrosine decarboxylase-like PLP-dependent enzyme
VGLGRRNNALKIYYTFVHYGVLKIRNAVEKLEDQAKYLIQKIKEQKDLFEIYTIQYTVVTFRIKDRNGNISDALTRRVAAKVKNSEEGFSSPS